MSERLEEVKRLAKIGKVADLPIYYWEIRVADYDYLIEQAEQNKEHNRRINKVRDYLQETKVLDDDINYWGMNVIDVLLSVSKEQKERIEAMRFHDEDLAKENKRYEKALKELLELRNFEITYGGSENDFASTIYKIARKALED